MERASCGCGSSAGANLVELQPAREPGTLNTVITWRDVLGGWKARWGIGRMRYQIAPGLYRIGDPNSDSPVLVTTNYKLTVDAVRKELTGINSWLLVLDTKGVNVWCPAGKGTFGTAEVIRRIEAVNLKRFVNHRQLVLPQLGATGVAAHEVKRATGFTVHYGPVRAADIKEYLAAGLKATADMRRVTFSWKERVVLTPVELVGGMKWAVFASLILAALELIRHHGLSSRIVVEVLPFFAAVLTGGFLVPLLLPFIPFRYFALKGAVTGAFVSAAFWLLSATGVIEGMGLTLLTLAISSYMAMMFTGSTTFTTLAGAKLEVRRALPAILVSAIAGAALRCAAVFV